MKTKMALAGILLASLNGTRSEAACDLTLWVMDPDPTTNIRASASLESEIIGTIPNRSDARSSVGAKAARNGWIKIGSSSGPQGEVIHSRPSWVFGKLLGLRTKAPSGINRQVPLRTGPSANAPQNEGFMANIVVGVVGKVLSCQGGWVELVFLEGTRSEKRGWLAPEHQADPNR